MSPRALQQCNVISNENMSNKTKHLAEKYGLVQRIHGRHAHNPKKRLAEVSHAYEKIEVQFANNCSQVQKNYLSRH